MKDYENNKRCSESSCEYYSPMMELNCSYSEDNSKCIKTLEPLSSHAVLGEVMAELEKHIVETEGGSYFVDFYLVQRVLSRYLA